MNSQCDIHGVVHQVVIQDRESRREGGGESESEREKKEIQSKKVLNTDT